MSACFCVNFEPLPVSTRIVFPRPTIRRERAASSIRFRSSGGMSLDQSGLGTMPNIAPPSRPKRPVSIACSSYPPIFIPSQQVLSGQGGAGTEDGDRRFHAEGSESPQSSLPEVRRLGSQFCEFLPGVQRLRALEEFFLGFNPLRIRDAAVDRTHGCALLPLKVADAFGTLLGNNVIEVV